MTKPSTSCFTVNGTIGGPYAKTFYSAWGHLWVYSVRFSGWYDEAPRRYQTYCDQNHIPLTRWWCCGVHPRLSNTLVQSGRIIKRVDFGADWTMHVIVRKPFPFMARHWILPYSSSSIYLYQYISIYIMNITGSMCSGWDYSHTHPFWTRFNNVWPNYSGFLFHGESSKLHQTSVLHYALR